MNGKISTHAAMFLAAALLSACGSSKKDSYQLTLNGCDTGKQEFKAGDEEDLKRQVCAALQDGPRNNNCAEALRLETFKQKGCPGTFSPR